MQFIQMDLFGSKQNVVFLIGALSFVLHYSIACIPLDSPVEEITPAEHDSTLEEYFSASQGTLTGFDVERNSLENTIGAFVYQTAPIDASCPAAGEQRWELADLVTKSDAPAQCTSVEVEYIDQERVHTIIESQFMSALDVPGVANVQAQSESVYEVQVRDAARAGLPSEVRTRDCIDIEEVRNRYRAISNVLERREQKICNPGVTRSVLLTEVITRSYDKVGGEAAGTHAISVGGEFYTSTTTFERGDIFTVRPRVVDRTTVEEQIVRARERQYQEELEAMVSQSMFVRNKCFFLRFGTNVLNSFCDGQPCTPDVVQRQIYPASVSELFSGDNLEFLCQSMSETAAGVTPGVDTDNDMLSCDAASTWLDRYGPYSYYEFLLGGSSVHAQFLSVVYDNLEENVRERLVEELMHRGQSISYGRDIVELRDGLIDLCSDNELCRHNWTRERFRSEVDRTVGYWLRYVMSGEAGEVTTSCEDMTAAFDPSMERWIIVEECNPDVTSCFSWPGQNDLEQISEASQRFIESSVR